MSMTRVQRPLHHEVVLARSPCKAGPPWGYSGATRPTDEAATSGALFETVIAQAGGGGTATIPAVAKSCPQL
jgi:hypothetical protein